MAKKKSGVNLGQLKAWRDRAAHLLTYVEHDPGCPDNTPDPDKKGCKCGLAKLEDETAEALKREEG